MQQTIPVNDAVISSHVGSTPSSGPFTVDFPFFSLNDVVVTRQADGSPTITTLVRGPDYSLVGVATDDGSFSSGTVTLVLPVSNTTITRTRDTPVERLSNFPLQGFFSRLALNAELNKMTVWMQEHDAGLEGFESNLDAYLPLAGGTMTGPVELGAAATVADPPGSDNDFSVANTRFVRSQVGNVITGLRLLGTWNALTNSPPLVSGVGLRGDFYICSVAGTTNLDGITTWAAGDSVVFNGVTWQRVPQTLNSTQIIAGLGYTPLDVGLINAAGDLLLGTADNVAARLGKGTTGQVLTSTAGSLAWANAGVGISSETTLASPASNMDITLPTGAKSIELRWNFDNTGGTAGIPEIVAMVGASPNATSIYNVYGLFFQSGAPTAASGFQSSPTTSIVISTTGIRSFGSITLSNLLGTWYGTGGYYAFSTGAHIHQSFSFIFSLTGVTGFRLRNFGGSPTFQVGSYLRCIATT